MAYDELKKVDAIKDRFLANVSHEMRSPVTAIMGPPRSCRSTGETGAQHEEMAAAF